MYGDTVGDERPARLPASAASVTAVFHPVAAMFPQLARVIIPYGLVYALMADMKPLKPQISRDLLRRPLFFNQIFQGFVDEPCRGAAVGACALAPFHRFCVGELPGVSAMFAAVAFEFATKR